MYCNSVHGPLPRTGISMHAVISLSYYYVIYLLRIPSSLSLTTIKSHKLISAIPSVSSFSASSPYPSFTKLVVLHRLQQTNGSPKKMRSSNPINESEIMPASHILNSCRPDRLTDKHIVIINRELHVHLPCPRMSVSCLTMKQGQSTSLVILSEPGGCRFLACAT